MDMGKEAKCEVCGILTWLMCDWCHVPHCADHMTPVEYTAITAGGLPIGQFTESFCDGCLPDDIPNTAEPYPAKVNELP